MYITKIRALPESAYAKISSRSIEQLGRYPRKRCIPMSWNETDSRLTFKMSCGRRMLGTTIQLHDSGNDLRKWWRSVTKRFRKFSASFMPVHTGPDSRKSRSPNIFWVNWVQIHMKRIYKHKHDQISTFYLKNRLKK